MNLNWMSLDDLRGFHRHIDAVLSACKPLERADLQPEISLSDVETVIRCAPGLPGMDAGLVMAEPFDAAPEVEIVAAPEVERRADPAPEAVPEADVEPAPEPEKAVAKTKPAEVKPAAPEPAKSAAPVDGLKTGALSDEERVDILDGHARGLTSGEIARRLNRKPQTIGLFINMMSRNGMLDDEPAQEAAGFRAIGEVAAKMVDAAPATQDQEVLGGEQGGLQRHVLAEDAAVQAGEQIAPPAEARQVITTSSPLTAVDRALVAHLTGLPRAMDWGVACDLDMCAAFARGTKLAQVALDMGKDAQWIKQRYAQVTQTIRDDRGHMTIDGQMRLLNLLRDLSAAAAAAGAA